MGACEPTPNRRPGLLLNPVPPSATSYQPQAHQRASPSVPLDKARPHGCTKGGPHSGYRHLADKDEVAGASPARPTTQPVTSGNAGCSASGGGLIGCIQ